MKVRRDVITRAGYPSARLEAIRHGDRWQRRSCDSTGSRHVGARGYPDAPGTRRMPLDCHHDTADTRSGPAAAPTSPIHHMPSARGIGIREMTFGTPILRLLPAHEGCRKERQSHDEQCASQNGSRYHHERVTPDSIVSGLARPPQGPWRYRGVRCERFVCRVDFPLVLALSAEVTQGAANIVVKHGAMCLAHRTLDGVRAVRGSLVIVHVRHRKTRALSSATCPAARTSSVHHVANEPESLHAMAVP